MDRSVWKPQSESLYCREYILSNMKIISKISFSQTVIGMVILILTGSYLLFPKEQKSEFFYLVFITIVTSGADGQFVNYIFKKLASKRQPKNPLMDDK